MSNYQAVYDAVREAFDISCFVPIVTQEICFAAAQHARPSAVYRPSLSIDGNQWCALYGDNLQDGVAGFGSTPAEAMQAFDKAWADSPAGGKA